LDSLLTLPAANGSEIRILQITDTHLFAGKHESLLGVNTWSSYKAVLDAIIAQHRDYDLIIATGDLAAPSRLWAAVLELPMPLGAYLQRFGTPIRYGYVPRAWPADAYQTVFATQMGSAEMPSAGRPFTRELVSHLFAAGVAIAPIVLHTGVSSLEDHEPPYEERFCVPRQTADRVNRAHAEGRRVIAVGTTVVRALETVTDDTRVTHPGEGWTSFVVSPEYSLRAVDGLLTGLHEPRATHLAIIQAVARRHLPPAEATAAIDRAYREAIAGDYLWHEFGDTHLILPA